MTKELKYVKSILREEIVGLEMLHDFVDDSIISAIDLLYSKRDGHVIVSGIGKPGHVGRKISATLASTGTPSFFLHPGEASHGDLGEISQDDVLLVLSLSGDTQELIPMLSYANRFNVAIVALTSNPNSVLGKSATVKVLMPQINEACPYNLAPTTTTTMMMAIGDAIALSLLKRKEFNRDDFKKLHPGGTLGKRLLTVQDLMHTNTPMVKEDDFMKFVLMEMTTKSFGCACVVNAENRIVGVITDGDLRRSISPHFLDMKASDIMTRNPKLISREMFAQEATKIMNSYKITSLFVAENGVPRGILHIHDCLRAGLA
jgi:arabinose-5-phosphate isomerase